MRIRLVAALSLAALGWACAGGESSEAQRSPSPCPTPGPASDAHKVPEQLRLTEHATITDVTRRKRALGVTAVSTQSVVELYPPLARAVLDAGYSIVSSDNEGFEAEIFFGDETVTAAYRLREGPCKDQVTIRLLFEERGR